MDTYFANAIKELASVSLVLDPGLQKLLNDDCVDDPLLISTMISYCCFSSLEKALSNLRLDQDPMDRNPMHYMALTNETQYIGMIGKLPSKMWTDQDAFGKTPLHYLIQNQPEAIFQLDIPLAAWKIQDRYNCTPFHQWIAQGKCDLDLLSKLEFTDLELESFVDTAIVTDKEAIEPFIKLAKTNASLQVLLSAKLTQSLVWGLEKVSMKLLESGIIKDLEYATQVFKQTPLIIAAMLGSETIIKKLLLLGSNINATDEFNMTALDYAVYHGYHEISNALESDPQLKQRPCEYPITKFPFAEPKKRNIIEKGYLLEVHLGTRDNRQQITPIRFFKESNYYAISISAENAKCVRFDHDTHELSEYTPVLLLPLPSKVSESFYIYTEHLEETIVYFDLHSHTPADSGSTETARASVIFDAPVVSLWREQAPVGGRIKVPITGTHRTSIGTMALEFVVVKAHPSKYVSEGYSLAATAWNRKSVALVGHRGLGMNRTVVKNGQPRLQLGENTIVSLTKGAELGADYVEFDVQLTKDQIPVLYHDFITSEWDNEVPVSLISSDQFKAKKGRLVRTNSHSTINFSMTASTMKPNGSGTIQSPFATLQEALCVVPKSCGFNVEIKYPHLEEAEKHDLHNAEINVFCDRILDIIATYGRDRDILFSSFHPDVCFLMCFKQNQYPVFFLTDGGSEISYDSRLNSLKNAVKVAKSIGCHGIVTSCKPLMKSLHVIPFIKDQGLRVYSYGGFNNSTEFSIDQVKAGIDGIIVDDVKDVKIAIHSVK